MSHLRAAIRALSLCVMTFALVAPLIAGLPLLLASRRARLRWRSFIFRNWAKAAAALLKVRIATQGTPPCAPFFLVANHLSYIDVIVLASQLDCRFIARQDVSQWPVIGLLCRSVGTIFIDRNNRRDLVRVNAQVARALAEGSGVVLFPEGTSSAGASVLPFKPGLLELASRADFAVSYAALSYRVADEEMPAHLSVCWWGHQHTDEMTFIKHLWRLLHVREVYATLIFGRQTIRAADRKALARQLHAAVEQQFIPVVNAEEEWNAAIQ